MYINHGAMPGEAAPKNDGASQSRTTYASDEKAPGAINTEGLRTNTANADHFPTNPTESQAPADATARLNRAKCSVDRGDRDHFFAVGAGSAIELCVDFASLQAFARRLGVSK